jgi:hypothetical protein
MTHFPAIFSDYFQAKAWAATATSRGEFDNVGGKKSKHKNVAKNVAAAKQTRFT